MSRTSTTGSCVFAVLFCLLAACPLARAQHGGGGGGGRAPGMGGPGGGIGPGAPMGGHPGFAGGGGPDFGHGGPPPGNPRDSAGTVSTMRGGLQLGPPGRWWDDKHFAKDLKLRADQQRHMDAIFEANRPTLLRRLGDLQGEQTRMEALIRARVPDEAALNGEIDRISQARAELEKANTHYLLQIRAEMDPEQLTRLEDHR